MVNSRKKRRIKETTPACGAAFPGPELVFLPLGLLELLFPPSSEQSKQKFGDPESMMASRRSPAPRTRQLWCVCPPEMPAGIKKALPVSISPLLSSLCSLQQQMEIFKKGFGALAPHGSQRGCATCSCSCWESSGSPEPGSGGKHPEGPRESPAWSEEKLGWGWAGRASSAGTVTPGLCHPPCPASFPSSAPLPGVYF